MWIKKSLTFRRELLPTYAVSKKFQNYLSNMYNAKFLRYFGWSWKVLYTFCINFVPLSPSLLFSDFPVYCLSNPFYLSILLSSSNPSSLSLAYIKTTPKTCRYRKARKNFSHAKNKIIESSRVLCGELCLVQSYEHPYSQYCVRNLFVACMILCWPSSKVCIKIRLMFYKEYNPCLLLRPLS